MPEPIIISVSGGFVYPIPATIPAGYVVEVIDHRPDRSLPETSITASTAEPEGLASLQLWQKIGDGVSPKDIERAWQRLRDALEAAKRVEEAIKQDTPLDLEIVRTNLRATLEWLEGHGDLQ